MVRAAWFAMELTGWFVIVPLAVGSLLTGIVQALGTTWGLFRHYWVLLKLLLTVLATVILLLHMPTVSFLAGLPVEMGSAHFGGITGELLHAGGGLVVLVTTTLSAYKPRVMTSYGWLKQHEQRTGSQHDQSM